MALRPGLGSGVGGATRRVVSVRGISGEFNRGATLGGVGLFIEGNRFVAVLNPSKYKGAALLELLTKFRATARNIVAVDNGSVAGLPPCGQGIGAIFRGCTLFPRLGMFSGVTFNLGLGGAPGSRDVPGIGHTLGVIGVDSCRCHSMGSLSNKRRRHVTVTHTVIGRPRMLLLSRPLTTLSLGVEGSVRLRLGRVRSHLKVAFMCIARSRRRTLALDSAVIIVDRKRVRRVKAPASVCGRPTGSFITSFVNRDGVLYKAVVRSYLMGITKSRVPYISGKFKYGRRMSMIVEPRSVRIDASARRTRFINGVASSVFGNMRCRVLTRDSGNYRFLVRGCGRFRIKRAVNVDIVPSGVRVVGGRHAAGAFRTGIGNSNAVRFLNYRCRVRVPRSGGGLVRASRSNGRIVGIGISFKGVRLFSGRDRKAFANSVDFVLCGNSRCRLAVSAS